LWPTKKDQYGIDEKKQRNIIGVTYDAWEKLEYELHLCLNILNLQASIKPALQNQDCSVFKDADVFEWSYTSFAERYGKEILEGKVKPVVVATTEQLAEIQDLLDRVKLPEGQTTKWFKAASCESFDEMDSDKVANIITYIKKTYIEGAK
jgi:hypothetical protein